MELSGVLYMYNPKTRLTAFESGNPHSSNVLVFIGGLTDGYNAVPYLPVLLEKLMAKGWSLVQTTLRSSYLGYGIGSLQDDSDDLDVLVRYLIKERSKKRIVFLGHSTGGQDCLWFCKNAVARNRISGCILQGPVSDREFMRESLVDYEKYLRYATKMVNKGKGNELMPREVDTAPITAYRYHSLASVGGDDDFFSSDLEEDTLESLFRGITTPLAFVHSGADEYVPATHNKTILLERLARSCPAVKITAVLPGADHALSNSDTQSQFVDLVDNFINHHCAGGYEPLEVEGGVEQ